MTCHQVFLSSFNRITSKLHFAVFLILRKVLLYWNRDSRSYFFLKSKTILQCPEIVSGVNTHLIYANSLYKCKSQCSLKNLGGLQFWSAQADSPGTGSGIRRGLFWHSPLKADYQYRSSTWWPIKYFNLYLQLRLYPPPNCITALAQLSQKSCLLWTGQVSLPFPFGSWYRAMYSTRARISKSVHSLSSSFWKDIVKT